MRRLRTEKRHLPIEAKRRDLYDVTKQFLKTPLDHEKLLSDLEKAQDLHKYTSKAFGGWESIPLRSLKGVTGPEGSRASGQHASSDADLFKDTNVMPDYISSIVKQIASGSGILKVRLMRLQAKRTIGEHKDQFSPGPPVARLHIPIVTNPDVIFQVNRKPYHMQLGHVYYIDVSQLHAVSNKGKEDRVHLVFDLVRNHDVEEKLKSAIESAQ